MPDNTTLQGLEFEIKGSTTSAAASVDTLSDSLTRLRTATSNGLSGLGKTAQNLKTLNTALNGLNSGDMSQKLGRISTALSKLSSNRPGALTTINKQLNSMSSAIGNIKWTDGDKLATLADGLAPLSQLKASRLTSYNNQLEKLGTVIDELEKTDLDKFTVQMKDLATAIAPFANEMNKVAAGFAAFPSRIQKMITTTEQYNGVIRQATKGTSSFSRVMQVVNTGGAVAMLHRLRSVLTECIDESNKYQEDLNLFTAAMGEYAASAQDYAEHVSDVLGIDPAEFMRNQGVFQTLATGFGDTADRAAIMSKNLTQLGYDISSFFNISTADAMQKLQSGISGELEPLRRLGYDLSQAKLQETALALGIEKKVTAMTQAEKAELRYYAIMNQVTTAQGDMARSLESPANQLRIFKAQVTQAARAIGNIFIPILMKILPVAIAVTKVVRMMADALAKLMGFTLTDIDYSGLNSGASAAGTMADNLDNAAGAAKKLKQYTAGFDELNVFAPQDSGGSGVDDVVAGGGLDIELPEYDFLGDAVKTDVDRIVGIITEGLSAIQGIAAGALLAIGLILAITGANLPLGLGLMAIGAIGLGAEVAVSWNGLTPAEKALASLQLVVGASLLAIGAILAISGANVPLGIGLIVAGAAGLGAGATTCRWNSMTDRVKQIVTAVETIMGTGLLAVGAILALSGVSLPLGLALIAVGATTLATSAALHWDELSDNTCRKIGEIQAGVGIFLLGIGAVLAMSGVNIPLGLGLMATGAVALGSAAALNWDAVKTAVTPVLAGIEALAGGSLVAMGVLMCLSGVGVGLGLALLYKGLSLSNSAWVLDDNPVTRFVKKMCNSVVGIVNHTIDAINNMFHISFSGLSVMGKEVIPAFDVRLVNIPKIPLFANGGFPDMGDLFIANENGAEMVGQIGKRTAVANNDQIVESIQAGVTVANDGVIAAIYQLIQAVEEKDMNVNIGDDDIGRANDRYATNRGVRVNAGAFANAY